MGPYLFRLIDNESKSVGGGGVWDCIHLTQRVCPTLTVFRHTAMEIAVVTLSQVVLTE